MTNTFAIDEPKVLYDDESSIDGSPGVRTGEMRCAEQRALFATE